MLTRPNSKLNRARTTWTTTRFTTVFDAVSALLGRSAGRVWGEFRAGVRAKPCAGCSHSLSLDTFCAACAATVQEESPPSDAIYTYGGALKRAICEAKFHADAPRAQALAQLFALRVAERRAELQPCEAICFVPAHWRRRLQRGFDLPQSFAYALGRRLAIPCVPALRCVRFDGPSARVTSAAARRRAVVGRYRASSNIAGLHLLLVDDVITTGATLHEASQTLLAAGASSVRGVALAATPYPGADPCPEGQPPQRGRRG